MDRTFARMRFRIKHIARYIYEQPVSHSHNEVRLAPFDGPGQRRIAFQLEITPSATITEYRDSFGNFAHSIGDRSAASRVRQKNPRSFKLALEDESDFISETTDARILSQ